MFYFRSRKELDREQAAIIENEGRGLGLMGTWYEEPDWYGGQIQQLARLAPHNGSYKVHLDPVEKRRSYRLARFLGSRRVLQLRIPDDMAKQESPAIKEFLLQKFILPIHTHIHTILTSISQHKC
ncbi:hypothetical protein FPV67DRAFT_1703475 [Lyophyllum atratum]|nr:hypothetical protein FPV67DRAFT_1703475 [Lyophyllum atratum]